MTVYILEGFFAQIPQDLFDAARMDGYSDFEIFWRVTVPIGAPAIFTTVTLNFIVLWNEFLFAVVLLTDDDKRTLPLGLMHFTGSHQLDVGMAATGLMIAMLPVIVIYAFFSETHDQGHDRRRRPLARGVPNLRERCDVAIVTVDGLCKRYPGADRAGRARRQLHRRRPRVHGAARPVGLRQVHRAAHDRGAGADHLRHGVDRRPGRQPGARQGARHRDGVPVLRAVSAHDRVRQSRLRLAAARRRPRGDRRGACTPRRTSSG